MHRLNSSFLFIALIFASTNLNAKFFNIDITFESGLFLESQKNFVSEIKAGSPEFNRLRKEGSEHLIESTGKKLRSMMSWMDGDKLVGDK
jgi:ketol-acid reductoisomerase